MVKILGLYVLFALHHRNLLQCSSFSFFYFAYKTNAFHLTQILTLSLGDRNFSLISITKASTPYVSLSTPRLRVEMDRKIDSGFLPDPLELKGHEINRIALKPIHKQMQSKVSNLLHPRHFV
jgi:hypothetical protein